MKLPNWFVCLGEALMEESKAPAQFTLTDSEREVLEHEVELAEYQQRHELVATLRRLLERLGGQT
jgi:hypothetical protein